MMLNHVQNRYKKILQPKKFMIAEIEANNKFTVLNCYRHQSLNLPRVYAYG